MLKRVSKNKNTLRDFILPLFRLEMFTYAEAQRKFSSKSECHGFLNGVEGGCALAPMDSLKMSYLGKIIREEVPHIRRDDFRTCEVPKHDEL